MQTSTIVLGLIFSAIGVGYFIYGRRRSNMAARWSGVALILYPYLVIDPVMMAAIGVGLMLVPRFIDL